MPHNFFALLKDGIEVTLRRFPGLNIDLTIPCPGHDGGACPYEFNYADLLRAVQITPPVLELQCHKSYKPVLISALLFGLHWRMHDVVLERIELLETKRIEKEDIILDEIRSLKELAQREFTNIYRREQKKIESHCPNVFVLRPRKGSIWGERLSGQMVELHLYCQAPGCWHPTEKGGVYKIKNPAKWVRKVAPYLQKLVGVLKYAAPLAGPWVGMALPEYEKMFKNDIRLMTELIKKLPDKILCDDADKFTKKYGFVQVKGAELRAIRLLLDKKDPQKDWGGLKKVLTPEGHYLWLCEHHAREYSL